MVRRRPRARNSIGIAGQRQRIDIRGSEYGIYRQPDRLVVHEEPTGTEHVTIEGNEHHVHLHTDRARPEPERPIRRPERPFFNFEEMVADLEARVKKRIDEEGIGFGKKDRETGAWSGPEKPKFVSRWGRIAQNVAHPFDNTLGKNARKFKGHHWLPVHPLELADAMGADVVFSTRGAGAFKFWKERRNYKRALALNARYEPRAIEIAEEFKAEANAALAELQRLVSEGRITRENRNFYFEKYEKAVQEAEKKFQQNKSRLLGDYMNEWRGKRAAT